MMSSQYRISESDRQERARMSSQLATQLETFLAPLLRRLDAYVDSRLVQTFVMSIAAIVSFRNQKYGLCLSELGAYLLSGGHAPAGTKRLSRLLHSHAWGKSLLEQFFWERADEKIEQVQQQEQEALCLWDGSVWEKPESDHTPGLCAVRSSKARRLKRSRPGTWNPPGGKAITVLGLEWLALIIVGMKQTPEVATMRWWSRQGAQASTQAQQEEWVLLAVACRWKQRVVHVFDRGYASKRWLQWMHTFQLRFVIRWKKGHVFSDEQGNGKLLWEIARGKKSWDHQQVWDEQKRAWIKMGVLAIPVRHEGYDGRLWLVVGRRKAEPWYLITNEPIATVEQAWHLIRVYARRWQIELTFRYEKSELALESPRLRQAEERDKLLLMVTLAYAYLLSLVQPAHEGVKAWLLRHYCHRTGKKCRNARVPLYRLRWALSRFWQEVPPVFERLWLTDHPGVPNTCSQTSG